MQLSVPMTYCVVMPGLAGAAVLFSGTVQAAGAGV